MSNRSRWAEMSEESQKFLASYLATLKPEQVDVLEGRQILADYFCADELNANLCADLCLRDEKRATCGLARHYDDGDCEMIDAGDLLIVQNWEGKPVCIVEFTHAQRLRFNEAGDDLALAEGEGDKSYAWWREAHWDFFSRELEEQGEVMRDDIEIVAEYFQRVWPL